MKVLLLNQCFYPDVVATAQQLTDLAVRLAEQGHQVTVVASRRGYDSPQVRFPKREVWKNINIIRLPSLGFGKKAKWRRAVDFGSFLGSCVLRLILLPRFDVVVALTSPPLISFVAALFVQLKGGRFVFWVMDLNPDEAVAASWLRKQSLAAKFLDAILIHSLRRAEKIVALDRFMKRRISGKGNFHQKIMVVPPWSHDDSVCYDHSGRLAFRAQHGLSEKYVVMYSGNHSPCHPLDTLLQTALQLANHPEIAFCFVGGGSELNKVKAFVKQHQLANITCLPYQPLDKLAASLSAADLHVVVMGDSFAGIVHPCKIYNILAVGAPFLYIGPPESHIADILSQLGTNGMARLAGHGEVEKVAKQMLEGAQAAGVVNRSRSKAENRLAACFSKDASLPRMVEALESGSTRISAGNSGALPEVMVFQK